MRLGTELEALARTAADDGTATRLTAQVVPLVARERRHRVARSMATVAGAGAVVMVAITVLPPRTAPASPGQVDVTTLGCGETLRGAAHATPNVTLTVDPVMTAGDTTTVRLTYPSPRSLVDESSPDLIGPTSFLVGGDLLAGTAVLSEGVVVGRLTTTHRERDGATVPNETLLTGRFEVCSGTGAALPDGRYEVYAWDHQTLSDATGELDQSFLFVAGPVPLTLLDPTPTSPEPGAD